MVNSIKVVGRRMQPARETMRLAFCLIIRKNPPKPKCVQKSCHASTGQATLAHARYPLNVEAGEAEVRTPVLPAQLCISVKRSVRLVSIY